MSTIKFAKRSSIAVVSSLTALLGVLTAAAPSQAARLAPPVPLAASMAPGLPSGAVRLGALAPGTKISFEVTLNIPDPTALTAFLAELNDQRSPLFQHFLAPGQFGPMFGPSLSAVAAVRDALASAGLSPGEVSADRLSIPVTATAAAIEHAFGITLDSYRLPGGREAYANTAAPRIPAAVAPLVQGVLGLDDLYPIQHLGTQPLTDAPLASRAVAATARTAVPAVGNGPQPCAAATGSFGNTADVIAAHYGLVLPYLMGDFGKGVRVGILELEPNLPSDIAAFEQCYGIATKVNYIKVDGGAGSGAGSGEAALDIEMVAGFADKSAIDVYQAPNNGGAPGHGFYDIFKKFVTSDTDKVLSVSWGSCEDDTTTAAMKAQETLFQQANAQGQTIFAAAGDQGSTSCFDPNATTADDRVSADTPASAPYVIGVGGTGVSGSGTSQQEVVWNDSDSLLGTGAGGGGVSSIWCMPNYQHQTKIPGIINADSRKNTSSSCASKYYREVPDISANADPLSGYATYYDGSWVFGGIGGTSAATPLWASIAALIDASPFCAAYGSRGATLPQTLYAVVAARHSYVYGSKPQVVRDVTSGNNDYTPSGYTGGLYPATRGYDMASGLGVPLVSGLFNHTWYVFRAGLNQLLCHQAATKLKTVKVTGVSPSSGLAGKAAKVKVRGAGFLPIAFTDQAQILSGSKVLATEYVTCSTTVCTVPLPAESARTVDIKIFAESLWSSAKVRADRYTYRK